MCRKHVIMNASPILLSADTLRTAFVESLSLEHGFTHPVNRCNVFQDFISLYSSKCDIVLGEYPFRTKFVGEKAVDLGGVTRDVFSAFFEEAYLKCFDGSSLLTPSDCPLLDSQPLSTLGTIISHVYLLTGMLPAKIAFPTILLPTVASIPDKVLTQCFVDNLSNLDASTLTQGLLAVSAGDKAFKADLQLRLITLLSMFNVRQIPTVENLSKLLIGVTKHHFLRKPAAAIAEMSSGVPEQHRKFWSKVGCGQLFSIYNALQASPKKVLDIVREVDCANLNQERVASYLRQYIGNMQLDDVRSFQRFVTGSAVCSANTIQVTFNTLSGLARRPIGHIYMQSTIELPSTYISYLDFVTEFKAVLNNQEYAWIMNGL